MGQNKGRVCQKLMGQPGHSSACQKSVCVCQSDPRGDRMGGRGSQGSGLLVLYMRVCVCVCVLLVAACMFVCVCECLWCERQSSGRPDSKKVIAGREREGERQSIQWRGGKYHSDSSAVVDHRPLLSLATLKSLSPLKGLFNICFSDKWNSPSSVLTFQVCVHDGFS